jgi:predicted DNA binding CopG/RHH family protein
MNKQAETNQDITDDEQEFWENHDSADYMSWIEESSEEETLPAFRHLTKVIPLHLPQALWDAIQMEACLRQVPYETLIEGWLQEKLNSL